MFIMHKSVLSGINKASLGKWEGVIYTGVIRDGQCVDEVYMPGWRDLIMWWERICSDVGFLRRCYHFILNEILKLMT